MNAVSTFKEIAFWLYNSLLGFGVAGSRLFEPLFTINGQSFSILTVFTVSGMFVVLMVAFGKWIFAL